MLNLFKSAIKKDSSAKDAANERNLDEFLRKKVGNGAPVNRAAANARNALVTERKGGIQSNVPGFRASEYGLVIRDLDKEREQLSKNQLIPMESDKAQGQAPPTQHETVITPDAVQTSDTTEVERMNARPDLGQNAGEGASPNEPILRSLDNEAQSRDNRDKTIARGPSDLQSDSHANNTVPTYMRGEAAGVQDPNRAQCAYRNVDEGVASGARLNQEAMEEEYDPAGNANSMAKDLDQGVSEDTGQGYGLPEDAAWKAESLDEEPLTPGSTEDFETGERPDLQADEADEMGESLALGNEERRYSNDGYLDPDAASGEEDDIDMRNGHAGLNPEHDEGDMYEGPDGGTDDNIDTEVADYSEQEEQASTHDDEASVVEENVSNAGCSEQPEEAEEQSKGEEKFGEESIYDAGHQSSTNSEDPLEYNDGLEGDGGLEEDAELEGDGDLEEGEEQAMTPKSAAQEERLSNLEACSGSQSDLDESVPENPLSVPGKEWTEAHMEAFRIQVRAKADIFDFLARKGVVSRERVSTVAAETLKLCLKDTTALRGKTHATVFMEAGGTPLGPFLAFLALTIQSTMNSAKDEKNANDEHQGKDTDEPQPKSTVDEADPWDEFQFSDDLGASPTYYEPQKPGSVAGEPSHRLDAPSKHMEVATDIMVVMFLQAILESSRAAISGPASAYLEWTFIPQTIEINSGPASCKDQNTGSLHEKRSKRTAAFNLKWEDVNPLEYVSIGTRPMYSKQHYIYSQAIKAPSASHMIGMMCERLRMSNKALTEYDRTTFIITSSATSISFAYAVFTPEYIKHYRLEEGRPATLTPEMEDLIVDSEPQLTIFESMPYDLSRWDEALEAAELALALVEFLQRNGPLLAQSAGDPPLNRGDSLTRTTSSASAKTNLTPGGPGKRFPIKIHPQPGETASPAQEDIGGDGDTEDQPEKALPTPIAGQGEDEGMMDDLNGDGDQERLTGELEEGGSDEGQALEEDMELEEERLDEGGTVGEEGLAGASDQGETDAERGAEGYAEEDAAEDEGTEDDRLENGVGESVEENSYYNEPDAGFDSPSGAPGNPYSNEGEEPITPEDQASTYNEDQYTPAESPTMGNDDATEAGLDDAELPSTEDGADGTQPADDDDSMSQTYDDDQTSVNQHEQELGGADEAGQEEEEEEGEAQYGDYVEGYVFDTDTGQYYPIGEDGQPYLPQE